MIGPLHFFVFAGLFSPGRNVILLTASGARSAFNGRCPTFGGRLAWASSARGFGIGALLQAAPALELVRRIVASAWILCMAYKLWVAQASTQSDDRDRPFTFIEAVLFHG